MHTNFLYLYIIVISKYFGLYLFFIVLFFINIFLEIKSMYAGEDPEGGGGHPSKIEKNKIFWRKIVIFHTKYPKIFRASLRSAQFF